MAVTYTQADLDNIRACIASGVAEVQYADGRKVRYQSLKEMQAAERQIAGAVDQAATPTRSRFWAPAYRSGC